MVILWTNLEGDRVEPSAVDPSTIDPGRQRVLKIDKNRGVKVAVKPKLPSLVLTRTSPDKDTSPNEHINHVNHAKNVTQSSPNETAPATAEKKPQQQFNRKLSFGKTQCAACKKKCSGEVLRVQDNYFHTQCFKCKVCANSLAQGGFFCKDGDYFCTKDYQDRFGTKCSKCLKFVEGEVVTALGKTYHSSCFTCARCRQPFPSGERVTFTGKEVLCQKCVHIPVVEATPSPSPPPQQQNQQLQQQPASSSQTRSPVHSSSNVPNCAGCQKEISEGQALIALDQQWHVWCFKCATCSALLHGEYMGKDGLPYCEKDYQRQFGVKCIHCERYIAGKVLQAGENHHFHPTCARCSKCGDPFGDGEEMYLQGTAIWHPRCGPGPGQTANGDAVYLNGANQVQGYHSVQGHDDKDDHMSSSAASEMQFSIRSRTPSVNGSVCPSPYGSMNRKLSTGRTLSPGLILRDYGKRSPAAVTEDITRLYTHSYLTAEPATGYLKKPIDPYDRPPKSPHFHRPSNSTKRNSLPFRLGHKPAMKALVDQMERERPRSKSPHMNNEEPIELAHYPSGEKPKADEPPRIERDDFPAPPYPYTDPERRRRWSGPLRRTSGEDSDSDVDEKYRIPASESQPVVKQTHLTEADPKLKKSEAELSKIATGIGKVFLQNLKEREKIRQWKSSHLDPRNASRTPSANKEPPLRLRYESPINASPSRFLDHPKPFDYEEPSELDRHSVQRSSLGRSVGTLPSYNVVSSLRYVPKPGYGFSSATRSHTFTGDYSLSGGLAEQSQHTDFGSNKSDISAASLTESERRALAPDLRSSATYSSHLGGASQTPRPHSQQAVRHVVNAPFRAHTQLRRSLPNMSAAALAAQQAHACSDPPKVYPAHLLFITNYRLPADVDRCHLERHLSDTEFEAIFQMGRMEFYRLPNWRRNELKKRAKLF